MAAEVGARRSGLAVAIPPVVNIRAMLEETLAALRQVGANGEGRALL